MNLNVIKARAKSYFQSFKKDAKVFYYNIRHWFINLYYVYLSNKMGFVMFTGYGHWYFAKKYADKRARLSRANKYCGGKRFYVLPIGQYALFVVDRIEVDILQSKGLLKKSINIIHLLKNSYYVTNDKPKK